MPNEINNRTRQRTKSSGWRDDFTYADDTDPASPFQVTAREYQIGDVQALLEQLVAYARALAPLHSESHAIDAVEARS